MKDKWVFVSAAAAALFLSAPARAQQEHTHAHGEADKLGTVDFKTSCRPEVAATSKLDPSRRCCICSSSHHATSASVVLPGVMTSLESARSSNWRPISPASPKATTSDATRREVKSEMSFSALVMRAAYAGPSVLTMWL